MSLKNWLNNGWLTEHRTSTQEITSLLAVADRDLADCRTSGLSSDWQLNIAYNAALQAATAGLIALLDQFRKKRNIGGYEQAGWYPIKKPGKWSI